MTTAARHALRLSLCASVFLPFAVPVQAQTPAQTSGATTQDPASGALSEVVVTAHTASASLQAPVQASLGTAEPQAVVTQSFIENIVPVSGDYSQTIKYTPSYSFSAPNGAGGSESKSQVLRGFADGQYNVTFDGIPFGDSNDYTHHTTSFFPAAVLGGAVVDRGPGQADTVGYATFGGTVALFSRTLTEQPSALVEGSAGSFGDKVIRAEGQTGALNATGTQVLVDYLDHRTDGALEDAGLHTQQALLKLSQPLGAHWRLDFFTSFNHTLYDNWAGITPNQLALYGKSFGALNNNPGSVLDEDYNYKFKNTDFDYTKLQGDALGFTISNDIYTYGYRNKERNGNNQTDLGTTPTKATSGYGAASGPKGNLDVLGNRTFSAYRDYGDIFSADHPFAAGLASGDLRLGVWAEHQEQRRYEFEVDWTQGGVFDVAPGANPYGFFGKNALGKTGTGAYLYDLHSSITNVQPFVEYVWKPVSNLTITPGFKYIDFTRGEEGPVDQTSLTPVDIHPHYTADLGYISANWRFVPTMSAYAQVAQGFLAPNANTLYTADLAKLDFQPQRTLNYQAGYVVKTSRFTGDVDVYYIDFNNYITTATDFSVSPNQTYSINGGGVVYKGVEAEGTVVIGYGLALFGDGSLNSAKTKGSNQKQAGDLWVAGAPDYTLAFGPVYNHGSFYGSLLTKRVGTRYFGANTTNLRPQDGTNVPTAAAEIVNPATGVPFVSNRLAPYSTTDLTLGYRFGDPLPIHNPFRAEFQVQNLFDSRRASDTNGRLLSGGADAIDPANTTFQYLAGRAFYGSLTLEF